jgi:hypothetical protein
MRGIKEVYEGLERFGFLAEVAGGAEKLRQSRGANAPDGLRREQARVAQVANGTLNVAPRSVLRQDGANNNFKAVPARPPVLRAMGREERVKIPARYQLTSGRFASGAL